VARIESEYIEYKVEIYCKARASMIPVFGRQRHRADSAEDSGAVQIGWQGRGCVLTG